MQIFNNIFFSSPSSRSSSPSSPPTTVNDDSLVLTYTWFPDARCVEEDEKDQIVLPCYVDNAHFDQTEDLGPLMSPRGTGDSHTVLPVSDTISSIFSVSGSPDQLEYFDDDTAIRIQPSRHVDYLSHSWEEEDIWSSWRHIVSRRGAYINSARLENASWRTWIKAKNNLKTISPEKLNWLKDCDVTWLYGPLRPRSDSLYRVSTVSTPGSEISKSGSFLHKKPILKKQSMSEIMLQQTISASSLLKQAAATAQAQLSDRRPAAAARAQSDYTTFPTCPRWLSLETSSLLRSVKLSGLSSPYEKKHIHFNEQVEECIALEIKCEGEEADAYDNAMSYESGSDDRVIMMKKSVIGGKLLMIEKHTKKSPTRASSPDKEGMKTIAMLPSTTLECNEYTRKPVEPASDISSSALTLPPSNSSFNHLLAYTRSRHTLGMAFLEALGIFCATPLQLYMKKKDETTTEWILWLAILHMGFLC